MYTALALTLLVALGAAWLLPKAYSLYRTRRYFHNLPGPPHSWIWGHLAELGEVSKKFPPNTHPQWLFAEIARKYDLKGVFYLDLEPAAYAINVIVDPFAHEQAYVKRAVNQHKQSNDFLEPFVGRDVIAVANGPIWKQLHHAILPAFSSSHLRSLTGVMIDEIEIFHKNLDKLAGSGEVFSMEKVGGQLIFDVFGRILFNYPLNAQTAGNQEYNDLHELVHLVNIGLISYNPFALARARLENWWITKRLDKVVKAQIIDRYNLLVRDEIIPSRKNPLSILDLMLRDYVEQARISGKESLSQNFTPAEMRLLITNVKGLMLGGHGTTADTLCFAFMLLSKHPEVVQKLREEHNQVFDEGFDRTIELLLESPQKTDELHYTNAVISEVLRLFPVGFGGRDAPEGMTVTYRGQEYPVWNGVMIYNHFDVHYDPDYFPEPSSFKPERYLDPSDDSARNYMRSFSRGTRACLGQNMARMELKVILLLTVRRYDFTCAGLKPNSKPATSITDLDTIYGDIIFQEIGLEAKPRGGMMMTVKKVTGT